MQVPFVVYRVLDGGCETASGRLPLAVSQPELNCYVHVSSSTAVRREIKPLRFQIVQAQRLRALRAAGRPLRRSTRSRIRSRSSASFQPVHITAHVDRPAAFLALDDVICLGQQRLDLRRPSASRRSAGSGISNCTKRTWAFLSPSRQHAPRS